MIEMATLDRKLHLGITSEHGVAAVPSSMEEAATPSLVWYIEGIR